MKWFTPVCSAAVKNLDLTKTHLVCTTQELCQLVQRVGRQLKCIPQAQKCCQDQLQLLGSLACNEPAASVKTALQTLVLSQLQLRDFFYTQFIAHEVLVLRHAHQGH